MSIFRVLFCLILIACGNEPKPSELVKNEKDSSDKMQGDKFVFVGDSLVDGYGVPKEKCFVSLVRNEIKLGNSNFEIINSGISGEASAGTLERIDWILNTNPHTVFLCIGSNDGLRGISVEVYRKNLKAIVKKILDQNVRVILGGIKLPINYASYGKDISSVMEDLAKEHGLLYYPFLLDGVAGKPALNLKDGIHPNEEGHKMIFEKLMVFFKEKGVF